MPTYEYACRACGHQWEQVQRIVEAPIEVCPKCGESSAHRLISGGTNFILKGGGWYSDLYSSSKPASKASESAGSAAPATSTASSEGTKSDAGGSATKTETKAPPSPAAPPTSSSSS
jgi:putative FmdB family regulatory protein